MKLSLTFQTLVFAAAVLSTVRDVACEQPPEQVQPRFVVLKCDDGDALHLGFSVAVQVKSLRTENVSFESVQNVPLPHYPAELLRAGVFGEVTLACVIKHDGMVTGIQVEKSDAPEFTKASIEALEKWRVGELKGIGDTSLMRAKVRFVFSVFSE